MKNQVVHPTPTQEHYKNLPLNFSIQQAKEIKRFYKRKENQA